MKGSMHRSGKNFGTIGESSIWAKKVRSPKPDGQSRVVEWGAMDGWMTDQTGLSNRLKMDGLRKNPTPKKWTLSTSTFG